MPPAFLSIKPSGHYAQITRINKFDQAIRDMEMHKALNAVAAKWRENFINEGRNVGGWPALSEMTGELRLSRGFNEDHPILQQYGHLYYSAITFPMTFKGKYGQANRPGASIEVDSGFGRIRARIFGDKVENQYGATHVAPAPPQGGGPLWWVIPPRPFWFVDRGVATAATKGMQESANDVIRRFQ
jgi:hypothetical protein